MGKITVFTLDNCPECKRATDLLSSKGASFKEISVTRSPDWKLQLFLLTGGWETLPQVFFNDKSIGSSDKLDKLEAAGQLENMIKECLEAQPSVNFPPELRIPKGSEFLELIPKELRDKWQTEIITELGPKLGATPERPISGLLIILDTPVSEMARICSAGPASTIFPPGKIGRKGTDEEEDQSYCQVAIAEQRTLFMDGPSTYPKGLKKNIDWVQFGYGWYLGAPWQVRDIKGTVVAIENEAGILKQEHQPIVEEFRDRLMQEFNDYLTKNKNM